MFIKLTKSVPHSRAAHIIRKASGKMWTLQLMALKAVEKHKETHHMAVFGSGR